VFVQYSFVEDRMRTSAEAEPETFGPLTTVTLALVILFIVTAALVPL
jgi:type II secretory pathway component PulF